uniref:Uncharacterized protein n=1 Tax=Siphoviridae sp. ctTrD1 TaxID=2825524 RepID=A0A8S5PQY9_9CAUD|nr:MAG TPA: hypothetical protein [Siphoviridae sp. ctTrD1]
MINRQYGCIRLIIQEYYIVWCISLRYNREIFCRVAYM